MPFIVEVVPRAVPEGYDPDEYTPAWELCKRGDDGARRIYICEVYP